jgi:hypothetical protein
MLSKSKLFEVAVYYVVVPFLVVAWFVNRL